MLICDSLFFLSTTSCSIHIMGIFTVLTCVSYLYKLLPIPSLKNNLPG